MDRICVARSLSNQALFLLLVSVTGALYFLDVALRGESASPFTPFTFAFGLSAVYQALRTYVVRTEFTTERIQHRTMFGIWRGLEYSKVQIVDDRGDSITIVGEDILGKSISIKLLKWDGDLQSVGKFLTALNS